jgi:alpha-L-fucosidase
VFFFVKKAHSECDYFSFARITLSIAYGKRNMQECEAGGERQDVSRAATVGYKRLLRFPEVRAAKVRLRILRSRVCPTITQFGLYRAPAR